MAKMKPTPRPVAAQPGYSPGYTWMLLLTFLAMAGGATLLFLELDRDYGFEDQPKGLGSVPKLTPLPPRDLGPPRQAPKQPLTRLPAEPGDDRAAAPIDTPPVEEPKPRVGPLVMRLPPSLPMPGIQTR